MNIDFNNNYLGTFNFNNKYNIGGVIPSGTNNPPDEVCTQLCQYNEDIYCITHDAFLEQQIIIYFWTIYGPLQ